ncbi:hypothetical protein BCR33DRAFT_765499 [Rhizoclosmatium globosum]|uniref:Uncharacterized protein n=1 Tax=Rhizoclosmatium globosum TaxID=329046 RepID=A0A1Y2CHE2_9FUNG|nr:hypothetical protein BCR33DRAFT_765499 [Rhizoclosmatium globosum]|eukprot:ORY45735.1 hypothetical protein BCR33DRAFT_765499 [Rhizoclosmatium globosum]
MARAHKPNQEIGKRQTHKKRHFQSNMEQLPPVWNLIQACVQTKGPSLPSLREQLSQHEKRYHELENNVYQSNLNFTPSFQAPHESLSPVPPASPSASQLSTPPPVYSSVPRNLLSSTPQSSQATLYAQVQPSFGGPSYRSMAPSQAKLLTPPVVPSSISTYRPSAPPPTTTTVSNGAPSICL